MEKIENDTLLGREIQHTVQPEDFIPNKNVGALYFLFLRI